MTTRSVLALCFLGLGGAMAPARAQPVCDYTVINSYPHDTGAFTQGLEFIPGQGYDVLYEGTGYWSQSSLRRVNLVTGAVEKITALPPSSPQAYFGEGITAWNGEIIQLTWQDGIAFVWEETATGFQQVGSFSYSTQGWGLTNDGSRLIMSDGSSTLYFRDPDSFALTGQVSVFDDLGPVIRLNELEFINGLVYANVWQTDHIVKINPTTGRVVARIDLSGLLGSPPDVLNGIAYDESTDRLFVTGKWWPTLFHIVVHTCIEAPIFSDGFELGNTDAWETISRSRWGA